MRRIQTNDRRNPARIIGVQFSIMSAEEIKTSSVVEISSKEAIVNGALTVGGLFDAKMGVLKQGAYCPTDGHTYLNCPGYFGHITLAKPVFYIQFIKDVVKVCKCICLQCGRLYREKTLYPHVLAKRPDERWDYCVHAPNKSCGSAGNGGCGAPRPHSIKVDVFTIEAVYKIGTGKSAEEYSVVLQPEMLYHLFRRISDDDVDFMGLSSVWSRPENMICVVLPVAPPVMRPSVDQDSQQRSEDDITHIYMSILKNNSMLQQKIRDGAKAEVIEKHHMLLQHFVAMLANNQAAGVSPIAQSTGRQLQCIRDRLDTKGGRIRNNLMGKRVDFSARSVITGDPYLGITELGVPLRIAMTMTVPVVVNRRNHDFLLKLVQTGPDEYPGAKTIDRVGGDRITLRAVDRMSIQLQFGDVVHRHLMDDDIVLFNRQPSLHKMSMQAHRVRVMPTGNTLRFNVAVTNPYNADFDGDEMNMHVPQSTPAAVELRCLPAVPNQIVSPAKNAPVIGIFQDNMLGAYLFTRPNLDFSVAEAMQLLAMYPHVKPERFLGKSRVTNYEILSQILPPITVVTKLDDDNVLEIRNGVWIRGQATKAVFGAASKGLLHRICNDFGNPACVDFINDLQNIITEFMKTYSYSVGIRDLVMVVPTARAQIEYALADGKQKVLDLITKVRLGLFENAGAFSNAAEFETQVSNILAECRSKAEEIGKNSLSKDNRFTHIVKSGAKGSQLNISQMVASLGQQSIDGKRAPYGYDNRTLPHFSKYDDSAAARGFVDSSYIRGLTPHEMFFHAMAGRIGLIDTAVKTSQTGYIQRRLVKALENIVVHYDGTARNNMGKIVQFVYGDDGFDSTKVESQTLPLVGLSLEDIYMKYDLVGASKLEGDAAAEASQLLSVFSQAAKTRITHQRAETRLRCQKYIDRMIDWRDRIVSGVFGARDDSRVRLPVSFTHIIANLAEQLDLGRRVVDVTPLEAFEMIEECHQKIAEYGAFVPANPLFDAVFFFYLSPKELLYERRFGRQAMTLLLETVLLRLRQAYVHPGEMAGIIAAQSIGEPTTQLTLNTFHSAGVASKANVTRGVPRIEEILRLTENPKNPSLTVALHAHDEQDPARATHYANLIECTLLRDIVRTVDILFDPETMASAAPSDLLTVVEQDRPLLAQYQAFCQRFRGVGMGASAGMGEQVGSSGVGGSVADDGSESATADLLAPPAFSPWVIRLEFDQREMLERNITMDDVYLAVMAMYSGEARWAPGGSGLGGAVQCVFSDYNDTNLVFRVRMQDFHGAKADPRDRKGLDQSDEFCALKQAHDTMLNEVVLRGVDGIRKAIPRKLNTMTVPVDGKHAQKDVWVVDTTGTNMLDVLGLPYIDARRTVSNDIREVLAVLGIEAARQTILNELIEVMEFNDVYIDRHHTGLTADHMTYSRNLVAIFRNGINKDNIGPIAKTTFEMHTEMFLHAAKHAELDNMRGISANVMCGQHGFFGTHAFQLHLDLPAFEAENAAAEQQEIAFRERGKGLLGDTNALDVEAKVEALFGDLAARTGMTRCAADQISIPNYLADTAVLNDPAQSCVRDAYDLGF